MKHDAVTHPKHYAGHPSGVECIRITEHMGFNLGNAVKYIWRCDLKLDAIEDLEKAKRYIDREITKRKRVPTPPEPPEPPAIRTVNDDSLLIEGLPIIIAGCVGVFTLVCAGVWWLI